MYEYINYLIGQYKSARGLNYIDINSLEFKIDFDKWLKNNQDNGINYASLIFSLGIEFTDYKTAEVNKGELDSVVLPYNTTIISPYIKPNNRKDTFDNEFYIIDNKPYYKHFNDKIFRYMTQNPYSITKKDYKEIFDWKNMHNNSKYEIVFGIYGNLYDEDRKEKIKKLEKLKKELNDNYIEEYDIFNDSYYYVLASKSKKIKQKRKLY